MLGRAHGLPLPWELIDYWHVDPNTINNKKTAISLAVFL